MAAAAGKVASGTLGGGESVRRVAALGCAGSGRPGDGVVGGSLLMTPLLQPNNGHQVIPRRVSHYPTATQGRCTRTALEGSSLPARGDSMTASACEYAPRAKWGQVS